MVEKISYLEIKLNSPHKDVVVIKGNENECDPVLFEGQVKLSLNSNIHFRKIKLSLIGEASIVYFSRNQQGEIQDQIVEKLVTLKVDWDNLLVNEQGSIVLGAYGDKPVKSYKVKKLHSAREGGSSGTSTPTGKPGFFRTNSTPHFDEFDQSSIKLPVSGVDGTPFKNHPSHHSFLLPKGNYTLPFSVVLPTNVSETVEGLSVGKMLYHLQCTVQKGIFDKPLVKSRYLRIFRTLHPTNLSLVDNSEINSTWPGKVEYMVCVHKKGLAMGSKVPIKIKMVPLAKGLKLKRVVCEIVQHHHVSSMVESSPEFENIIGTQQIYGKLTDDQLSSDCWEFSCNYRVPSRLQELTQTCTLNHELIQVRHRLRIVIHIQNPDGRTSELRANLPVTIYISSNIGHVYGNHAEVDPVTGVVNLSKNIDDPVFKRDRKCAMSSVNTPLMSPIGSPEEDEEGGSEEDELSNMDPPPPLYEQSKFDKIYDISSPKSPSEQLGMSQMSGGYFDLSSSAIHTRVQSSIDLNVLSKVPSYNEAVEEDDDGSRYPMSPSYDPSIPFTQHSMLSGSNSSLSASLISSHGSLSNLNMNQSRDFSVHQRTRSSFKLNLPKKNTTSRDSR
ncbi:hypothetical protein CANTEDRAFT_127408 [Yamadazyma tenuis ATCC 10573]|uniref:Arrestin C-terminal-like domain-containing protein n=1 Tax=Candida tenuis (strain ATCC 10573 / BCRC 21748 / CBS 615 / JCM 9827 / NBRC 10315 / NRRL Y-1498 / VKM Y-70) TaxID=590646 RepID=G3BDG5_CANTC|nr:uncharacterized protein CANTEDRAFT_127408 [Yamadazyma tenuis ATCC 10573]EGV60296.1 hypothetical protein CANTEDRAFT_127408 [Yamadazyma tenuis ATCC 10573]